MNKLVILPMLFDGDADTTSYYCTASPGPCFCTQTILCKCPQSSYYHLVDALNVAVDTSSGTSYGPKYYKTWLPRGLPNITNVDILAHQKPENDAANDPEACSRLYDQTLHIIRKRVGEIEAEQKAQKGGVKKPEE